MEQLIAVVGRTPAGSRLDWAVGIPAGTLLRIVADDLVEALGNPIEDAARRSVAIGMEAEISLPAAQPRGL